MEVIVGVGMGVLVGRGVQVGGNGIVGMMNGEATGCGVEVAAGGSADPGFAGGGSGLVPAGWVAEGGGGGGCAGG